MALSRFVLNQNVTVPAGTPGLGAAYTESPQSNPAAATNFVYVNNTGQSQVLQALQAFFTASATVGNRFIQIQINDAAGTIVAYTINGAAVVASTTLTIDAYIGATQVNSATGTWVAALPSGVPLLPGYKVSITAVWQAGDQLSSIDLFFSNPSSSPGAQFGTEGFTGAAGVWTGGPMAYTFLEGTTIYADSSAGSSAPQLLYQAIGAANLRAYVQGQDDVGHAALAN